jgi:hypothetical protein
VYGRSGNKYGKTVYYPFSISGETARSTSFSVQGESFVIQSYAFIVPNLTILDANRLNISVVVPPTLSCADIKTAITIPVTQPGTLAPKIIEQTHVLAETGDQIDGYSICFGSTSLEQDPRGMVTVSISHSNEDIDMVIIGNEAAGW